MTGKSTIVPARERLPLARKVKAVFFSYSPDDYEFALKLAEDVEATGAVVWLYDRDAPAGQFWDHRVYDALTKCPGFLVILSPSSVSSGSVKAEVHFALHQKKGSHPGSLS